MRRLVPFALALLTVAPLPAAPEEPGGAEEKVHPMPEFRVRALDGRWLDSQELRGNVVLIDLWGTWCPPCLQAMPAMDKIYRDLKGRGLVMIGIAVDSGTADEVSRAVKELKMSYPVALWNEHLAERIQGLNNVPTYIILNPDWTIHKLYVGATSPRVMRKQLEILLDAGADQASR